MTNNDLISSDLYRAIADVIQQARQQVRQAVNQQMVQAYWQMDMYRMYGMSRWHGCQGATMYVRMYEEQKHRPDDNPTIGLILCSEHNKTVAKYSVLNESKHLFASKYLTELPSEEELQQEIEREREKITRIQESQARYVAE